jgi:replicative DNA helicase
MAEARYQTGGDVLAGWKEELLTGTPPTLYPVGAGGLARLEVGPGLVTLLGGAPGAGKSALSMQLVVDALRLTPELRVLVCNVEMAPKVLLDRQLARLSGIDLSDIRHRRLDGQHGDRLDRGLATLDEIAERLCFVRPPFNLDNVAAAADDFEADLLLFDYIQRIAPSGDTGDRRAAVDSLMNHLRQFADADRSVFVVAAVARTRDNKGRSSYAGDGLGLASFRESSELEFGADDAFILVPDDEDGDTVTLRHLKSRSGEPCDLKLLFDRRLQRFTPEDDGPAVDKAGLQEKLAEAWRQAAAAEEDEEDV